MGRKVSHERKNKNQKKGLRRSKNDYAEAPFSGIRFKKASNSVNIAIQSLNHTLKIIQQR